MFYFLRKIWIQLVYHYSVLYLLPFSSFILQNTVTKDLKITWIPPVLRRKQTPRLVGHHWRGVAAAPLFMVSLYLILLIVKVVNKNIYKATKITIGLILYVCWFNIKTNSLIVYIKIFQISYEILAYLTHLTDLVGNIHLDI